MGEEFKRPHIKVSEILFSELGLAIGTALTYLLFFCNHPLLAGITITISVSMCSLITKDRAWEESLHKGVYNLLKGAFVIFIVVSGILFFTAVCAIVFFLGSIKQEGTVYLAAWGEICAILLIPLPLFMLSMHVHYRLTEKHENIFLATKRLREKKLLEIRQAEDKQNSQLKKSIRCKVKQGKDSNIVFKMKRKFPAPLPDAVALKIEMEDITNDDSAELPILGLDASLQFPDSEQFRYNAQGIKLLADEPDSWKVMAKVFFSQLSFAYSKKRRVKIIFTFRIEEGQSRPFQFEVSEQLTLNVKAPGYLETLDFPYSREKEALRLALYVASIDGKTVSSELKLIKEHGSRIAKVDHPKEIIRKAIKADVNTCLRKAGEMIQNGDQEELFEEILSDLQERSEKADLYDIYNWCLKIVKADGVVHPEEMGALTRIRHEFKLDEQKAKRMRDRALAGLHIFEVQDDSNADKLLGIETSMSKEGIRTLLNAEFRTWNGRVNHEDEDTRTEAATRLAMIAAARTRHIKL